MFSTIIKNNWGLKWLNPMNDDEHESSNVATEVKQEVFLIIKS